MDREPLLTKATWVVAVVVAVIAVAVTFGPPLTDEKQKVLLALIGVLAPVVTAVWGRRAVTPVADPRDDEGNRLVRSPDNDNP